MPSENHQSIVDRQTFGFEEYVDVMAGLGGRVMITDPDQAPWTAETLDLDGITLQRVYEGGSNTYEGESAEGMIGLFVRIQAQSEFRAFGRTMDADSMAIVRPGYPATSTTTDHFHYYTITLPVDRMVAALDDHDPAHTERLLSGPCMFDITPGSRRRAVEVAGAVMAAADTTSALGGSRARRAAAGDLLEAFLEAFTSRNPSGQRGGRPRIPRRRVMKKIQDYLHLPGRCDLSVPALAAHVGVAERTLRNVFTEQFGVSPKKFLQIVQVHDIRADLLRAPPGATVTTIAADRGVWDHGRLARRYRQVFGETPSRTLARSRTDTA